MLYVLIFAYLSSAVLAYFIVKRRTTFLRIVLRNVLLLFVSGVLMLITGIQETTLLAYILLVPLTLLGILTRILTPIVLNFIGNILAKILNRVYEKQNYEQMMQNSRRRMFFCVLQFTTLKVFLYIMFIMSALKLI